VSTEPRELVLLIKAEQVLAEARTLDDIKDIRDKAQAAQVYAKKAGLSKSIIVHASAIKVQAERRMGQMLSTLPLAGLASDRIRNRTTSFAQASKGTWLPVPVWPARVSRQVRNHIARPSLPTGRPSDNTVFQRPERLRPVGPAPTQPNHHATRSDST
jgi:hypothetical protein